MAANSAAKASAGGVGKEMKRSRSHGGTKHQTPVKNEQKQHLGYFSGISSFFKKLSKNEMRQRKFMSTQSKKLPKNFANQVLDLELKIDSGAFDIGNVN